ncbi:endonuclease MutS2 [Marininema halotolerans]|uniref:Endonuclease MutS2 n=1 Tax=Marininema halotolerans TaxID=1155944 RepID=A0A1I6S726_9BACL|nr:endonuclease MutS2 [Marininema halotolerans]SFS72747.1 DNA mismatch repair protein MutS2 [Marininema halotolerans]
MELHTLQTLEYSHILALLEEQASSEMGKEVIRKLSPSDDPEKVRHMLATTAEGMDVLRLKGFPSLAGVKDIRSVVKRARLGSILSPTDLRKVAGTAYGERQVKNVIASIEEEETPLTILRGFMENLTDLAELVKSIHSAIDVDGQVMDDASTELARIRRSMTQLQGGIRSTLDQMIKSSQYQKMLQDPIVTQRNDRYVLPVKQEYRSAFGGMIHDQSASGQTLFIEPEAVVQQNNRLRELEWEEEREVERILSQLTEQVAECGEALLVNLSVLTELDIVIAKGRFGGVLKGVCPEIAEGGMLILKKARHPLIPLDQVVPLDVELGGERQGIIITGPNTGGKTVSLKTVGLLALMGQSGMPIPAEDGSVLPVYNGIFADIGDEQSIEQNLSTFSAHMTNIIRILDKVEKRSLVLLDELGAGTDPTEGAALAISILEYILAKGSPLMATTHYNELKVFAHSRAGVTNASVEFDVETLSPTYRLLMGVPGKSNAFDIARRLGLPQEIVAEGRSHISTDENRLEEMISGLTKDRRQAEEDRTEAEQLRMQAEHLHQEYEEKLQTLETEKEKLREKARLEARTIVTRAKRETEEVMKELREWAKARPQELKEHQLTEMKKRLDQAEPEASIRRSSRVTTTKPRSIQVGDQVLVRSFGQKGQVTEDLGGGEFQVSLGLMKMKVSEKDMEWKSSPKPAKEQGSTFYRRQSVDVKHELDLRGKMVEEAIPEIDKYLDDALMAGYPKVSLIHGKGTGALRTGVQKYLQRHPRVKEYRLGEQGEGGTGVTVVELR